MCICDTYHPCQQPFHLLYGGVVPTLLGRDIWTEPHMPRRRLCHNLGTKNNCISDGGIATIRHLVLDGGSGRGQYFDWINEADADAAITPRLFANISIQLNIRPPHRSQ